MLDSVIASLNNDQPNAVDRLAAFLRIASVGTDPAYKAQTSQAADWIAHDLASMGLDVQSIDTPGHPVIVARSTDQLVHDPQAPRVLVYGHYDVQPADPVELWQTPPFDPQVRHGAIYARGACDDKGQLMTIVEAMRHWISTTGKLPGPVTVMVEGEEEQGSIHLPPVLEEHKDLLHADVAVVSDTQMWKSQTPAITYSLRGLLIYDIQLLGPDRDLHSGMNGGFVANPAVVLTQILGQLVDQDYRVTLPGFYDDLIDADKEERKQWEQLGFDPEAVKKDVGMSQLHGEKGFSPLERNWLRPTCDINGLYGGYGGEGSKTIIPSRAGAKVSFRLVANQDPLKIADQFETWIHSLDTHGLKWRITQMGAAYPVQVSRDSPYVQATCDAVAGVTDHQPALIREGATIPIIADIQRTLNLDTILLGFAIPADSIHAPNESFGLDRFHMAAQCHAAVLQKIAAVKTN